MNFSVPLVNTQTLGNGISATYHSNTNTAVMAPDFFATTSAHQANIVAHEYLHSTGENRALVAAATAEQVQRDYYFRPWETPALEFGLAFEDRFRSEIFQSFPLRSPQRR